MRQELDVCLAVNDLAEASAEMLVAAAKVAAILTLEDTSPKIRIRASLEFSRAMARLTANMSITTAVMGITQMELFSASDKVVKELVEKHEYECLQKSSGD